MILNSLPSCKLHHPFFEVGKDYEIVGAIGNGLIVEIPVPEDETDEVDEDGEPKKPTRYVLLATRFENVTPD